MRKYITVKYNPELPQLKMQAVLQTNDQVLAARPNIAVTGVVTLEGIPLPAGTVSFDGASAFATDAGGTYAGTLPFYYGGNAQMAVYTEPRYTITPPYRGYYALTASQAAQDYEISINYLILSGVVTDSGTGMVADVTNGTTTWQSSASGSYGYYVPYGWSGTTTAVSISGTFTPAAYVYTAIGVDYANQDFAFTSGTTPIPPATYLISGTVTESGFGFSAGLDVTGLGMIFSAASGSYGFLVTSGYSGTVTPQYGSSGSFVPAARVYSGVVADAPNQDYVFYPTPVPPVTYYEVSGTFGNEADVPGGLTDFAVTNGTDTWFADSVTGSYAFMAPAGWSGSVETALYITLQGYVLGPLAADKFDANFTVPTPAILVADNYFNWSVWPFTEPDRWLISARNPVDLTYSAYATNVGSVYDIVIADTGSWYNVRGIDAASNDVTFTTADTYAAPPLPPIVTLSGSVFNSYYGGTGIGANLWVDTVGTINADGFGNWTQGVLSPYTGNVYPVDVTEGTYTPAYRSYVGEMFDQFNQDFALEYPPVTIYGMTTWAGGTGFAAPLVIGDLGTIRTDASGSYSVPVPYGWSGTLLPLTEFVAGTFNPASIAISGVTADLPGQDFGFWPTSPVEPMYFLISGVTSQTTDSLPLEARVEVTSVGTVVSDETTGSYGVLVQEGYAGTVIPHFCSGAWGPTAISYGSVGADTPNQDFALTAVTEIGSLQWTIDETWTGQMFDGTYGVTGAASASGTTGTYWSVSIGDGTTGMHMFDATFDAKLARVNKDSSKEKTVRTKVKYQGSHYTTNMGGGISNTSGQKVGWIGKNAVEEEVYVYTDGSFGGTIVATGSTVYGCSSIYAEVQNYVGQAAVPPAYFYSEVHVDIEVDYPTPPVPTDCQIPLGYQTIGDLPTPNQVSRSVNDPVNNLLWYVDDSYDYVYYVDAVAGTFQGSIELTNSFGQSAIVYDPTNDKVVVMDWSGSIHVIDPVAKTSTRVPSINMPDPGFHMLAVNDVGTVYATDNRNVTFGSVYAIDVSSASLIRSTKLPIATDSICWASNINKLVINSGGAGQPAFYIFDPATDTFAASTLLNPAVSFRYENFYIPQTGHMLESFSGGQASAVIDISQGTAATQITTIQPTRVSNADIDTCTDHLFVTNGNYAMWEYTLDGSYSLINLHDRGGAGINPNSCSHNRQSNLIYVADYGDGTIYTYMATTQGGSLTGMSWVVDQGVSPDGSGGYMAAAGTTVWFNGSATGDETSIFNVYSPDASTSIINLGAPYPVTMTLVYSGSIQDSGTVSNPSYAYMYIAPNSSGTSFSTTGTNGVFNGTLIRSGTVNTGYNLFDIDTQFYNGGNFTASPCNTYVAFSGTLTITPS